MIHHDYLAHVHNITGLSESKDETDFVLNSFVSCSSDWGTVHRICFAFHVLASLFGLPSSQINVGIMSAGHWDKNAIKCFFG